MQAEAAWTDGQPVLVVDEHLLETQVRGQHAERCGGDVGRGRLEEHDERARRRRQHAVYVLPWLARRPVLRRVYLGLRHMIHHARRDRLRARVIARDFGAWEGAWHYWPGHVPIW